MLVSASKDSTSKLWDVRSPGRAAGTLPGHADEVGKVSASDFSF